MKVEEQQPKDQPKDAVDGNTDEEKDTVIERTKSISEQLSKVYFETVQYTADYY